MYVVNDNGILSVFDAATGREVYKARAGGTGNTFSASPWASDGRVYLLSEDGDTFVIEAGDKVRGVGQEQPRGNEPGHAGACAGRPVHPDADTAVSDRTSEVIRGPYFTGPSGLGAQPARWMV